MKLPPSKPHPELDALLKDAKTGRRLTAAEFRAQRISWAYGNTWNDRIARDTVERIHDEMYGRPED